MRVTYRSDEVWDRGREYARDAGTVEELRGALADLLALAPGDALPGRPFRPEGRVVQGVAFGGDGLVLYVPHEVLEDVLVVVYIGPDLLQT